MEHHFFQFLKLQDSPTQGINTQSSQAALIINELISDCREQAEQALFWMPLPCHITAVSAMGHDSACATTNPLTEGDDQWGE